MNTICNVRIFDGTAFRQETSVSFDGEVITALDNRNTGADMDGLLLCPGFVDIHMHGQLGLDSMRPGENAKMAATQVQYGVTAFCPASVTQTDGPIRAYLADIQAAMALERGARVLGAYLEGPYLAEPVRGAHDADKLRDPELSHYQALTAGYEDEVVRVTLAPERKGGMELVSYLKSRGVTVSIGHSAATAEECARSIELGVNSSTHTCNGMEPLHHRKPGVLGVTLTQDAIRAEFIADLIHIDPILIRLIYRAKGPQGCYYCTDSLEAAGMPDGVYNLGGSDVTVHNGIAKKGDSLAGSTLTMDQGLRNLVQKVGLPLADALGMGTRIPAQVIGRTDLGRIAPGCKADFILLDRDLRVRATYVRGICEYREI